MATSEPPSKVASSFTNPNHDRRCLPAGNIVACEMVMFVHSLAGKVTKRTAESQSPAVLVRCVSRVSPTLEILELPVNETMAGDLRSTSNSAIVKLLRDSFLSLAQTLY